MADIRGKTMNNRVVYSKAEICKIINKLDYIIVLGDLYEIDDFLCIKSGEYIRACVILNSVCSVTDP